MTDIFSGVKGMLLKVKDSIYCAVSVKTMLHHSMLLSSDYCRINTS